MLGVGFSGFSWTAVKVVKPLLPIVYKCSRRSARRKSTGERWSSNADNGIFAAYTEWPRLEPGHVAAVFLHFPIGM